MAGQADPIDRGRETLLRALREGDVRFVVIDGAALQSHGQRYETEDIDVTPDRAQQNLARLADVLNRLECSQQVGRLGPPQPKVKTPASALSIAHDLLRAYARREELRVARAQIADPQSTRRDRARVLAYDLGLTAIEEEIAALEQSSGAGPLSTQQRADLEPPSA
jgi:hypothetical protein